MSNESQFYTGKIDREYYQRLQGLKLPRKTENNKYLLLHLHGDGGIAPRNFNVKVYEKQKDKSLTLVTTDKRTLDELLILGASTKAGDEGKFNVIPKKQPKRF